MILTREIHIKINESNYQYYEDLGYDVIIGNDIKIPIELMSKGSHYKIKCKCDNCGLEKDVIFKNYINYNNKWGEYYCRKCSEPKRRKTLRKNFGVDYPIQNKKVLKKMKSTIIEKYGVDNISKIKSKYLYECNVDLSDNKYTLQDYDELFKNFKQWTQFKREIKLESILNEKKIQFDIKDIQSNSTNIYGTIGVDENCEILLEKIAFVIKEISFIIKGNYICELKLNIKILKTECGKKLKEIIKFKAPEVKQKITQNKSIIFYIE